jgi:hypothetical protein
MRAVVNFGGKINKQQETYGSPSLTVTKISTLRDVVLRATEVRGSKRMSSEVRVVSKVKTAII